MIKALNWATSIKNILLIKIKLTLINSIVPLKEIDSEKTKLDVNQELPLVHTKNSNAYRERVNYAYNFLYLKFQ